MFGSRARRTFHLTSSLLNSRPDGTAHRPQVQLDLFRIGAHIPALGEHGLRLLVCIVSRQPIIRGVDGVVLRRVVEVAVEVAEVTNLADAQRAAVLTCGVGVPPVAAPEVAEVGWAVCTEVAEIGCTVGVEAPAVCAPAAAGTLVAMADVLGATGLGVHASRMPSAAVARTDVSRRRRLRAGVSIA